ncbi:hypothetical protein Ancab_020788 [Ancistrocladus abbreviatus]
MKKGVSRGEKCFLIVVMFGLQIIFMSIMRSSDPASQDEAGAGASSRNRTPLSLSLLKSKQDNPLVCDRSSEIYDWCYLNRPSIFDPKRLTFFTMNFYTPQKSPPKTVKIRPYPRKWEPVTMSYINEITLTTTPVRSTCQIYHNAPALVFSVSGYTGNFFHDFNDGIIPLFITINTLFDGQDVTLVVTNFTDWWHSKYEVLLSGFTKNPIINLDNQTVTHCFPGVAAGLITHGPMTIDPALLPSPKTFIDFRAQLGSAYDNCHADPPPPLIKGKPRLVFMTRKGPVGRVILNHEEIIHEAKEVGFDVVEYEPSKFTWLCESYNLMNSSHAVMGVHGAALTHSMFLRPGAVLAQVVPLANDWVAQTYFKKLAVDGMKFEYLEYKVRAEESSLAEKYGKDHVMVRNAGEMVRKNWTLFDTVYLKGQDVRLDIERFRDYVRVAYKKAKRFMEQNG